MQNHQLIEFAALVSQHSRHVIGRSDELGEGPVHEFCYRSGLFLQQWRHEINRTTGASPEAPVDCPPDSSARLAVDFFAAEVMVRVWSSVLAAVDRRRKFPLAEPLLNDLKVDLLKSRYHALYMMLGGDGPDWQQANRIRRKTERWTDLLLGHLVLGYGVSEFTIDVVRARDFGEELVDQQGSPLPVDTAWNLILTSIRAGRSNLQQTGTRWSAHWVALARSVLSAFPDSAFSDDGPLKPESLAGFQCSLTDCRRMPRPIGHGQAFHHEWN